jgi:hypothetical protein
MERIGFSVMDMSEENPEPSRVSIAKLLTIRRKLATPYSQSLSEFFRLIVRVRTGIWLGKAGFYGGKVAIHFPYPTGPLLPNKEK